MKSYSFEDKYDERQLHMLSVLKKHRIPSAMRVFAIISSLIAVCIVLFITFVPWVQTIQGAGKIVALDPSDREQAISALVPGRIAKWYVREGSRVQARDPIALIVDNDPRLVERLNTQLSLARERLASAQTALRTAQLDATRKEKLLADGLVSRLEMEQAQIALANFEVRAQGAADDLNRAELALSREGSQELLAPRAGVITRVMSGGTSTFVKAGDRLAQFVPDNIESAVEIYVDGRDASLVSIGKPARLQFEGWPVVQFSGWPSVAVGTFSGEVSYVDPIAAPNGLFRVVVKRSSDGPAWPPNNILRVGTNVRGWVLLDEVSVAYELWRQLNNFPPEFPANIAQPDSGTSGAY
ncbi:efflux RND transporter periplasmic adaptor subunit [Kordiimonas aquimaris]|uniref:efflux RND transporter periplasmic adaptor subunit n=1 Tax=Kordiimonas aquimaris TaxID=707591 RepID=UPI0021D0BB76|nr:HlyD family efflux transporter periplasmic adaptor subunit [Kordiimonas aquimaris]